MSADPNGTVLAVVEPAIHPQSVVGRAAWIARLRNCRLHVMLCDPEVRALSHRFIVSNEGREIRGRIREAEETIVEELAEPVRAGGLAVETSILEERSVAGGVLQAALELEPRVIVKGTQYHSQARRAVFVDTDWQLIRSVPYPLWLVKPHDFPPRPVIVAAVDPTHEGDRSAALDRQIIDQTRRIAAETGAQPCCCIRSSR